VVELGPLIANGRTAAVYALNDREVLKLFRDGWGADHAAFEAGLARQVHAVGMPAPAVLRCIDVDGRAGIVYERLYGPSLQDWLGTKLWRIPAVGRQLAEAHASVHARTAQDLPARRAILARRIRKAWPLTEQARSGALRALETLPDGDTLCHGDLNPGNILLTPDGPVVIDWVDVARGHPLSDVARTLLLLRMAPSYATNPAQCLIVRVGAAQLAAAYLHRYRQLRPAPRSEIAAWTLPVAAARLDEGVTIEEPHLLRLVERLAAKAAKKAAK
jgi:Ser/Thr protein kinase RdoA (MazF antagonist)